jgi:VanZ family protein
VSVLLLWGPVVLHMALIFAASSTADLDPLPGTFSDKPAHLGVYAVLGGLLARAFAGGWRNVTWPQVVLAVVLSTAYGVSDEFHQSFVPGRTPDAMDVVADAAGAALGAIVLLLASRQTAATP